MEDIEVKHDTLLWVEKYRPRKLKDVVGQHEIIARIQDKVRTSEFPHLLFRGPAGTGKTTTAQALVHDILGKKAKKKVTYLEINSSDARGIDVVRTTIKDFVKTEKPNDIPFKILILEEFDSTTMQAQQAFRSPMEKYSENCLFIITCNYSNKIIRPIQSRCSMCSFSPLKAEDIINRLSYIAKEEKVSIDNDALSALAYICEGDCRSAINHLQSCANLDQEITADTVYRVVGKVKPEDIRDFISLCISKKIVEAKQRIMTFLKEYGMSGKNIIKQIHRELPNVELSDVEKRFIIRTLGNVEYRLSIGATEDVQLIYMIMNMASNTEHRR